MNLSLKTIAIMLSLIAGLQAMEEMCPFNNLPERKIKTLILAEAAIPHYYNDGHPGELASVCTRWYKLINHSTLEHPLYKTEVGIEEYCQFNLFIKGRLIYRPHQELAALNDNRGMKTIYISDLINDLKEFTPFDLNVCGDDISKNLQISPGYRKVIPEYEEDKLQIWIVLRSEIERELKKGNAQHFKKIFEGEDGIKWKKNAPIGIFWTASISNSKEKGYHSMLSYYDYLITENFKSISNDDAIEHNINVSRSENDLRKKWSCSKQLHLGAKVFAKPGNPIFLARTIIHKFSFSFNPTFKNPDAPSDDQNSPIQIPCQIPDQPFSEFRVEDEPLLDLNLFEGNPCIIS